MRVQGGLFLAKGILYVCTASVVRFEGDNRLGCLLSDRTQKRPPSPFVIRPGIYSEKEKLLLEYDNTIICTLIIGVQPSLVFHQRTLL
jgi:hypothetical protein